MSSGYVYVLTNESMPGLVKIGRSSRSGRSRAAEIYTTGVPTPFVMEFEIFTQDCVELEILVHEELQSKRVSECREFFRVDPEEAVMIVLKLFAYDYTINVDYFDFCLDSSEINEMFHRLLGAGVEVIEPEVSRALTCLSTDALVEAHKAYKHQVKTRGFKHGED